MTLRAYDLRTRRPKNRRARPPGVDIGGVSQRILRLWTASLSDPEDTIFAASSPTPMTMRAVCFDDAP